MSKINLEIGSHSFELIRERVCEILAEELNYQHQISNKRHDVLSCGVWLERFTPFNVSELPALSVRFSEASFDNHDASMNDSNVTIIIDCYTKGRANDDYDGDRLSNKDLGKLLGVCKSILQSPYYITLGFAPPFIKSRRVMSIRISDYDDNQDAENVMMGRITLRVDAVDQVEGIVPVDAVGYDTQVKLEETEKGYKYTKNN